MAFIKAIISSSPELFTVNQTIQEVICGSETFLKFPNGSTAFSSQLRAFSAAQPAFPPPLSPSKGGFSIRSGFRLWPLCWTPKLRTPGTLLAFTFLALIFQISCNDWVIASIVRTCYILKLIEEMEPGTYFSLPNWKRRSSSTGPEIQGK